MGGGEGGGVYVCVWGGGGEGVGSVCGGESREGGRQRHDGWGGRKWSVCVCVGGGGGRSREGGRERHDGGGGKEMECMYMCLGGEGGT